MGEQGRRAMSARQKGLLLAVAFALIGAGVTLFVMFRGGGSGAGSGVAATNPNLGKPPPPAVPQASGTESGLTGGGVGGGGRARIEFVDKKDPTRKAGELEWSALEPLEERGWSLITEPRAWLYAKDGKSMHVQAAKGRVYRSEQGKEPESGRFEGAVVLRVFEPLRRGVPRAVNLEKDRPSVLLFTESLSFDTAKAEFSTRDRIQISTVDLEFVGTGLLAVLNQVQGRLESLEIDKGDYIRMATRQRAAPAPVAPAPAGPNQPASPPTGNPGTDGTAVAAGEGTPAPPTGGDTPASSEPRGEPVATTAPEEAKGLIGKETIYRALFGGDVRLTQEQRTLEADNLEVWARLVNNQLPPGAIGEIDAARRPSKSAAVPTPPLPATEAPPAPALAEGSAVPSAEAGSAPATAVESTRTLAAASSDKDLVLKWTGPLVVRPLDSTPPELENGNHVALRFTADKTGAVAFRDDAAGVNGKCVWIGYGATARDLTLAGPGPTGVTLATRGGQKASVGRIAVNLGTGIGHIPGGGMLEDAQRRITWADQADLVFVTERGEAAGLLKEASFTGSVLAKDPKSTLAGDFVKASFLPSSADAGRMLLSRLVIDGKAIGDGGDSGKLEAANVDVAFRPSPDGRESDPELLIATGGATASRKGLSLSAEAIRASLARQPDGKGVGVMTVAAKTAVRFADTERNFSAGADQLDADVPRQTASLLGKDAFVAAGIGRITSPHIELDGLKRELVTPGAGTFTKAAETKTSTPDSGGEGRAFSSAVTASWSGSMRFSDSEGLIECTGDVSAISGEGTMTVDALAGQRLVLSLTPLPPPGAPGGDPANPTAAVDGSPARSKQPERQLLSAEVFASNGATDDPAAPPAIAERRKYIAADGAPEDRKLEQFLRVSGGRIVFDSPPATTGKPQTVGVPGKGEAAVFAGQSTGADRRSGTPDARGATLFTWAGSMDMDLSAGVLNMHRSVTLFHRPLNNDPTTRIEGEHLEATLKGKAGAPAASSAAADGLAGSRGAELVKAVARGAVYVESGTRKVIADLLAYNAIDGTSEASASDDNKITMFDDAKGTAVSARRMFWDMTKDRVEVTEPSPIVIPR